MTWRAWNKNFHYCSRAPSWKEVRYEVTIDWWRFVLNFRRSFTSRSCPEWLMIWGFSCNLVGTLREVISSITGASRNEPIDSPRFDFFFVECRRSSSDWRLNSPKKKFLNIQMAVEAPKCDGSIFAKRIQLRLLYITWICFTAHFHKQLNVLSGCKLLHDHDHFYFLFALPFLHFIIFIALRLLSSSIQLPFSFSTSYIVFDFLMKRNFR